ncbi:MAG TPA: septum site-determining protein MinC [Alphaproteobacteria bacterium]|nr:septum site-determining protein MinC [Alphaproteobacteria bacterium]
MDLGERTETVGTGSGEAGPPGEATPEPFRLKGGGFTLLVLEPLDLRAPDLFRRLMDRLAQAPNFYRNAPVVIDLAALTDARPINFAELANRLRQHRLIPVGVMNPTPEQAQGAANAGLALLPSARPASLQEPRTERQGTQPTQPIPQPSAKPVAAAPAATPAVSRTALVISEPVRAGAQVYAEGRDLVLLSPVSAGAEVLADGHIHAYGRLRGRALAGIGGDEGARIFCRSLEAELVSIAGRFRVSEDMDGNLAGRPTQIFLDGGFLMIEPLGTVSEKS